MTVKLLSAWGNQPPGTLYTSDANTEAAMIAAKVATATLAGAGPWTSPGAPPNVGQSSPIILAQSVIPMILPSSGTMGANGSLTGLTALPCSVFPQACFMYFPAGKVFSGSPAGMYYASILTTTTAQVYNNMYTSGRPQDAIPAVPTPVVDAGPGAYTQTTGSLITVLQYTIPAGSMGVNGSVLCDVQTQQSSSANGKLLQANFGALQSTVGSALSSVYGNTFRHRITNVGVPNKQIALAGLGASAASIILQGAENTASDVTLQIQLQHTTSSAENFVVTYNNIVVYPG